MEGPSTRSTSARRRSRWTDGSVVPILCELDDQTATAVTSLIEGTVQRAATLPEAALALAEVPDERLLVIGPVAPLDQVLDFMHTLRTHQPDAGVVLVRNTYDPAAIATALEAGVTEVVPPGNAAQLAEACRRA